MAKEIKLNLGCGSKYKPGYINIDKFDKSVADRIGDVDNLPFESNSVDLIEALQLIEHFDYIQCKYILSEWFKILKPKGSLILETPDLEKTYEKFISSDSETKITTLQWVFGIDSEGMVHKTGFTFNLLKELLEEIGFEKILEEKQKTYKYEHGLRISCKKPENLNNKQLYACFRKKLKNELKTNDSIVLIPLEDWFKITFEIYETKNKNLKNKENWINNLISQTIICTPNIPLIFLEECIDSGILKNAEVRNEIELLKNLNNIGFHKKIFTLWIKNRKEIGEMEGEFQKFIEYIEKLIIDVLKHPEDYNERLNYILNLEPTDIKIFDIDLILLEADKLFNIGIKYFHQQNYSKALDYFIESSRLNSDNYRVYWNIARLCRILDLKNLKEISNYEKALSLVQTEKDKKTLENELDQIRNDKGSSIPNEPVTEEY